MFHMVLMSKVVALGLSKILYIAELSVTLRTKEY